MKKECSAIFHEINTENHKKSFPLHLEESIYEHSSYNP